MECCFPDTLQVSPDIWRLQVSWLLYSKRSKIAFCDCGTLFSLADVDHPCLFWRCLAVVVLSMSVQAVVVSLCAYSMSVLFGHDHGLTLLLLAVKSLLCT